ncbi:MAG TPA: ABC transporter permease [Opitutaceae bacterium]|nr:ABC transporter permease [Opitutaceae bacterium]
MPPETIIRPIAGSEHTDPVKIWEYRHLFWSLVTREVRVKFDNVKFGALWACARPALMVVILVGIRGGFGGVWPEPVPYAMFVYSGIILWFYFCDCLLESAHAVERDAAIISKVFFPRLISPMVPLISNSVEFVISAIPLAGFMIYFRAYPGWQILLLPVVLVVTALIALGLGLIFAGLMLHRRDWERVLGLLLYVGLFASPVFHSYLQLTGAYRTLEFLNPVAGVLSAFRSCLTGAAAFPTVAFLQSTAYAIGLMALGTWQFRRQQDRLLEML